MAFKIFLHKHWLGMEVMMISNQSGTDESEAWICNEIKSNAINMFIPSILALGMILTFTEIGNIWFDKLILGLSFLSGAIVSMLIKKPIGLNPRIPRDLPDVKQLLEYIQVRWLEFPKSSLLTAILPY